MFRMKYVNFAIVAIFLALAVFAASAMAAEQIRISGDPCTVPLAKKLGEAFTKKTGIEVVMKSGGCRTGVADVIDGAADIGVSTFNFGEGKLYKTLNKTVIGHAPIVMIVNKNNAVGNISKAQLHDILSGNIRNWSEVGGADMVIKNVMLAPCVVETMTYQTDISGNTANLRKLAPKEKGNPVMGTNVMVEGDDGAIGMQLLGYESPNVKVLTIEGDVPQGGVMPASYEYYEEYNMVTKGEPAGAVKQFIDFALSPEGQQILVSMKHIPRR